MAELIDNADENIINQLAMMYAVALTKYGVDIREKFDTATQMTMTLNQAYIRGRQDEIEKFRVLQSGYEAEIRNKAIDEFAEKMGRLCENSAMALDRYDGRPLYNKDGTWHDLINDVAEQLKGES